MEYNDDLVLNLSHLVKMQSKDSLPGCRLLLRIECNQIGHGLSFRRVTHGIESFRSSFSLPRHRHLRAYATVVLAGNLEESGYSGRLLATAGDVLIHPTLDCHANRMVCAGVKLIRLEWPDTDGAGGLYRLNEVDALARTAEKDVAEAALLLEQSLQKKWPPAPGRKNDWPDALARDLAQNASTEIGAWAEANGLARETISRGFAAAYGVTPAVFRAETRARAAWLRVTRGSDCLCTIAAETGFADQAHMTRWIGRITGAPPAVWRRDSIRRRFENQIVDGDATGSRAAKATNGQRIKTTKFSERDASHS
jgi:AraC-like DNA-binding protein